MHREMFLKFAKDTRKILGSCREILGHDLHMGLVTTRRQSERTVRNRCILIGSFKNPMYCTLTGPRIANYMTVFLVKYRSCKGPLVLAPSNRRS